MLKEIINSYEKALEVQLDSIRDKVREKAPWTLKYQFLNQLLKNKQQQRARVQKKFFKLKKFLFIQAKKIVLIKRNYNIFDDGNIKAIIQNFCQNNNHNIESIIDISPSNQNIQNNSPSIQM
ncbi:unnamed protein product [Paramecium sonneborni]|uniref:Uncharacterized protein n=1 Tax=Paramecium sonneborni TaxID=65129 RepID=A0A8S1MTM3_9CILI|nr:unnamed protein product [Paramecium sonneborni]